MGLPAPERLYHFVMVETANGVSLDFATVPDGDDVVTQHYAFLVSEDEFDAIFGRILERGLDHWADPGRHQPGRINHNDGGRGVYFPDPSGHLLEIITRPYGSG
jgi:catechol 2,3-dioxygenase-like lactoylglutathione lyase family enzyme